MAERAPIDQAAWQAWIDHVCAALDIDPGLVDATAVHQLSGEVAARFTRPMAPVGAFLWGMAVGSRSVPDAEAREAVVAAAAAAGDSDSGKGGRP